MPNTKSVTSPASTARPPLTRRSSRKDDLRVPSPSAFFLALDPGFFVEPEEDGIGKHQQQEEQQGQGQVACPGFIE